MDHSNSNLSFLDFMLSETEKVHALARRYTSPDEHAFYPNVLPRPILPELAYSTLLVPNSININEKIKNIYLSKILEKVAKPGEEPTSYGSTATADIAVLQALSKRIHFGKFIAEAKFRAEEEKYGKLIRENDAKGIMDCLTNLEVEKKVLRRVTMKASTYGQDVDGNDDANYKVNPQDISDLYRDFVMPLTKEVQVAYLLQRLHHPSIAYWENSHCLEASQMQFGGENERNFEPQDSISKVFGAVMANQTALGIVPLEDSLTGMVKETQMQMIKSSLKVVDEIVVKKNYAIGYTIEDRQSWTSFVIPESAQTIAMNIIELASLVATIVKVENTLLACNMALKDSNAIALVSMVDAKKLGLKTMTIETLTKKCLPDSTMASVRYIVLSKNCPSSPTGKDKSILYLSVKHQVGGLLMALSILEKHGVNMTCLESIHCEQHWKYDFFIEVYGHGEDQAVDGALQELDENDIQVKCLGSYSHSDAG